MPHLNSPLSARSREQRGAATLIVVMLLFFIMSMVAAYTSRNLIFEQRTSANQYRSSQAFDAAEAGLEWAIAQLNAGRTTDACAPSTSGGDASFAQRYLSIDAATGAITPLAFTNPGTAQSVQPRCVFDSSATNPASWNWSCSCPLSNVAAPALAAPGGSGPSPAFVIRMRSPAAGGRLDLIELESNSCTRLDTTGCLRFVSGDRGGSGDGVASTGVLVALRGAVTRPPAAALSVAGALTLGVGSTLSLSNQEASVNGVTLHTTGAVPAGIVLTGAPGVPPAATTVVDATLTPPLPSTPPAWMTQAERTFALFFGVFSDTYFAQPGMVEVDCSAGCDAAAVNLTIDRNPGRAIRVKGHSTAATLTTLTIDANVGSTALPALLIVDANVDVSFSAFSLVGMIYGRKRATPWLWTLNGAAGIQGAAVAEGDLSITGANSMSISYSKSVLTALRVSYGTFVRVPGSWKDFQ